MFSSHTNTIYYIGSRIRDINTNNEGKVYAINVLGTNGIRVLFDNNTKKAYFGNKLLNLVIIS